MASDFDAIPDPRQSARTLRASLIVLIILLGAIVLVQLLPKPGAGRPAPTARSPFVFARQPEIRVRVASLDAGESIEIGGLPKSKENPGGKIVVLNQNGTVKIGAAVANVPFTITPAAARPLSIADRRYQGDLLVVAEPDSPKLHVVNRLPVEQYLEGVVLAEMPSDYHDEALRAQAVASRSYAAWQVITRRSRAWDVTDTQKSQVYRGAPARTALAQRIVRDTRGLGLTFDGRVIEAVFSSTCGGNTRGAEEAFGDPSVAPLAGTDCGLCRGTQFSTWKSKVKRSDVGRTLGLGGSASSLIDATYYPSERLAGITVKGPKGEKHLSGNQFKDLFGNGARSTWLTSIAIEGDSIVIEGRGFGHGVGMCQVGAQKMAQAGQDFRAILAKYYPGATLTPLFPLDES